MSGQTQPYSGSCHCGAIQFAFEAREITRAMLCDCSICRRRTTPMSAHPMPKDQLDLTITGDVLRCYSFGTGAAKHYFCGTCGVFTHVEPRVFQGHYLVNLGCVEGVDPFALKTDIYDGKSL